MAGGGAGGTAGVLVWPERNGAVYREQAGHGPAGGDCRKHAELAPPPWRWLLV